jgi:tetratricopeptide (TPR) repeat protein
MRKGVISVLVAIFLVTGLAAAALAEDYAALIKEGDSWYAQRADSAKAKMAVETYKKATQADPAKSEGWWKLSRALYWVGDKSQSKDAKRALFQEGIEAAKKAIGINANEAASHYWLGVNYGLYGKSKGVMKSLSLVDPIKKEMAAVIKIDPKYNEGGAYMVLGNMYFVLPGIAGGSNDKAMENLKTAIKYGPKNWTAYNYLAEVYIDEDMNDEAKKLLETVIAGGCGGKGPGCPDDIAKAKKLMKEVQ